VATEEGSTTARGYGTHHQKLRARWALKVDRGKVYCARCGGWIMPGTPWDLGHVDGDKKKYSGPEHAACNRSTAGRRRPPAPRTTIREWESYQHPTEAIPHPDGQGGYLSPKSSGAPRRWSRVW
jgi:hypothetical protein